MPRGRTAELLLTDLDKRGAGTPAENLVRQVLEEASNIGGPLFGLDNLMVSTVVASEWPFVVKSKEEAVLKPGE